MAKNRDYTGLVRTPSSMAWLIAQRRRKQGVIDKLQKTLDEAPAKIAQLKVELGAIDAVIPMHEVVVDPNAIKGSRPGGKHILPRGNLKRHILNYLRSSDVPLYTDDIALHVAKLENIDFEVTSRKRLNVLIRYRLKQMAREGILERHHPQMTREMGRWSLRDFPDD